MALRLFFMRHGETDWSLSGQHSGRANIPLTTNGEDEARHLGERTRVFSFSHVLSSPLQRAWRTCELTGLSQLAEIEPDLAEWDNGDYEEKTSAEIHASRPGWNVFRDGCPGGEMPDEVSVRTDQLIERLTLLDGNVALFSHSHFGRVLAARWIGLAVVHAQSFVLNTASLSILGYEHDSTDQPATTLWNCAPLERFVRVDP